MTITPSCRARTSAPIRVYLAILGTLWLSFTLSVADPGAAERYPEHGHVVLAGGGSGWTEALAGHQTGAEQPREHDAVTQGALASWASQPAGTRDASTVVVRGPDTLGSASFATAASTQLAPEWLPPLVSAGRGEPLLALIPTPAGIALHIPEPPPRV